jgi:PAS domain S-box-containing protein
VQAFRLGGRESRRVAICFSDITERKKAEEALRRSNEISSAILNATTETLWLMDLEGNILGANETAAKRLGKTVAEVIGKNGFVLTPPHVKELRQAKILEMAQTGKSVQFQDERDGIIFHHTFYPVRDALGAVKGLVSFSRDITEQKRAEEALKESEERFKAIALTTPVGIGVVDASKAVFLYINSAYEKAFGYAESELLGRKTPDIYWSAEDREKILGILKEKAQVAEYEVKLKRKDGTSFWGLSSVRPIIYGGRPALLGAFVDITDRKNAEERLLQNTVELRRSNEELERFNRAMVGRELRMVELKKQVNELCSKLGEPRKYKTQFEEGNKEPLG